jgi:hypothetical protein
MQPLSKPYPFVDKLIDLFVTGSSTDRRYARFENCITASLRDIARELHVTPGDLDTLVRQGQYAIDELPKLLRALCIDEEALARSQPLVLRDMQQVCASCRRKVRCDHDLGAGTAAQHYAEYCINAGTIDALIQIESEL